MKPVPVSKPDHKYCPKCKTEKPFEDFYFTRGRRHRLSGECKPCHRERFRIAGYWKNRSPERKRQVREVHRRWYIKKRSDPAKVEQDRQRNRDHQRKKVYGITSEDFNALLQAQNDRCAICKSLPTQRSTKENVLHVDHCHNTGKVRGLLCLSCNHGLGKFRDSPTLLRQAAEYLS